LIESGSILTRLGNGLKHKQVIPKQTPCWLISPTQQLISDTYAMTQRASEFRVLKVLSLPLRGFETAVQRVMLLVILAMLIEHLASQSRQSNYLKSG